MPFVVPSHKVGVQTDAETAVTSLGTQQLVCKLWFQGTEEKVFFRRCAARRDVEARNEVVFLPPWQLRGVRFILTGLQYRAATGGGSTEGRNAAARAWIRGGHRALRFGPEMVACCGRGGSWSRNRALWRGGAMTEATASGQWKSEQRWELSVRYNSPRLNLSG